MAFADKKNAQPYVEYNWDFMGKAGNRKLTDKIVRYPYPKKMGTSYQKSYPTQSSEKKKFEPFNLEKEHRIINPHKMELRTTNRADFQSFRVVKEKKPAKRAEGTNAPLTKHSSYAAQFPNWGQVPVFHEKDPQYPYYSLPFRGTSSYGQSFTG